MVKNKEHQASANIRCSYKKIMLVRKKSKRNETIYDTPLNTNSCLGSICNNHTEKKIHQKYKLSI